MQRPVERSVESSGLLAGDLVDGGLERLRYRIGCRLQVVLHRGPHERLRRLLLRTELKEAPIPRRSRLALLCRCSAAHTDAHGNAAFALAKLGVLAHGDEA